jgi:hypothetical protein
MPLIKYAWGYVPWIPLCQSYRTQAMKYNDNQRDIECI